MSVFISIVSYRDAQLGPTIQRALQTARHPDRVHFGVVDQNTEALPAPLQKRLRYVRIDPRDARGPCWARALAISFYDAEDWFLQLDSHMDFEHWWDRRLINQATSLGRKTVLASYPNPFVFADGAPVRRSVLADEVSVMVLRKDSKFEADHPILKFEGHPVRASHPMLGIHVAAGCLFTSGQFALEFPCDPAIYFHGEEQALALRLFTHGWDIYHPVALPIYHLYLDNPTGTDKRPLFHEDNPNWLDLEKQSRRRLTALTKGAPLGVYGLGTQRSLADFAAFSGIDYERRTIAQQAYAPRIVVPGHG